MSGWSDPKEEWDQASGLVDFRVHDLRRTMKSTLQNVRPDLDDSGSELWLQYRPTGIKGVYDAGLRRTPSARYIRATAGGFATILDPGVLAGAACVVPIPLAWIESGSLGPSALRTLLTLVTAWKITNAVELGSVRSDGLWSASNSGQPGPRSSPSSRPSEF